MLNPDQHKSFVAWQSWSQKVFVIDLQQYGLSMSLAQ
jgi:hypothetical protein